MKETHLVQKNSTGRIKFITFNIRGNIICREWGLIDGKKQHQESVCDYINKGKINELSPNEAAEADCQRIIETKIKEGYQLVKDLNNIIFEDNKTELDFNSIPTELCCSKPIKNPNIKKINKALKEGRCTLPIKYNGMCHYILCTPERKIKIYTRRMDDHTEKYPFLVYQLEQDCVFPERSIAICELVVDPLLKLPHMEGFKILSKISRLDTLKGKLKEDQTQSLNLQKEYPVKAAIFGMLYWGGNCVACQMDSRDRFKMNKDYPGKMYFVPVDSGFESYEEAIEFLEDKENGLLYEGFIAWMLDEKLDISFSGKPKRRAAYKIKVPKEDDVIAYDWNKGKEEGKIGSLCIGKLKHEYGWEPSIVEFGNVGTGLKDKDLDPSTWNFPQVIEIIYDQRFPTGKYQFPRFNKKHEDKVPEDVYVDENGF